MKDINKSLESWLSEISSFDLTSYEKLPDIELYMDQMLTYYNRSLKEFTLSSLDKPITSSMINNYVKGEVIPAPMAKRYSREQLSLLLEIYFLKKTLQISDIKQIFDSEAKKESATSYNDFKKLLEQTLKENSEKASKELEAVETNNIDQLLGLVEKLSIEATVNALIAERILDYIRIYNDTKKED